MANNIFLTGTISSKVKPEYEIQSGEIVYGFDIEAVRKSGNTDRLPCYIPSGIMPDELYQYDRISIVGEIRTRNVIRSDGRKGLDIYVWVMEFDFADKNSLDVNKVEIDGYTCREIHERLTALENREIADVLIASTRRSGKSDYIPCIVWGRMSKLASRFSIGTHIYVEGRMQSRTYTKRISDTEEEERVAYEVSIKRVEVYENEEN